MELLWKPDTNRVAQANITRFMAFVSARFGVPLPDYAALYAWSLQDVTAFWQAVWDFTGVQAEQLADTVLQCGNRLQDTQWFVGARLNFAKNLLRYRDERLALVFRGEDKRQAHYSYAQLYHEVARLAASLRNQGIGVGDRVAAFMPNIPQTIIGMLAATSLGAVWSSCSPDFGHQGVLDRFGQIAPKVLLVTDGYFYAGKTLDVQARVQEIVAHLPSVAVVIVVPYIGSDNPMWHNMAHVQYWDDFLAPPSVTEIEFVSLPFNHPLYILYSSGTTGIPKCIVHGAGGTLLQHLKEHVLHTDLRREDVLFYYTTCGWMMWNWLASGLSVGATLALYDGSPFHPHPGVLWDFAQEEGISVFGTSAKYLAALEKVDFVPREAHELSALRTVLSTGSPLAPESFNYVYQQIKSDVQLSSISGGTDIVSCFALGNPIAPVYRGELQTRGLGMKVEIFNEVGQAVQQQKGELVCSAPFPSMPLYFWNDPAGDKYHAAYFSQYPNCWCHGDYAELTVHDGVIIHGRSDTVLNPGGVRIGTAEIYRQVENMPEIVESLVIGQAWDNDVRVVLFVRLRADVELDETLIKRIKQQIKQNTTPRHVPAKIVAVADIPRTISGKIVELAVRNVVHGLPVKNIDALANPEALRLFQNLPVLQY